MPNRKVNFRPRNLAETPLLLPRLFHKLKILVIIERFGEMNDIQFIFSLHSLFCNTEIKTMVVIDISHARMQGLIGLDSE